MLTFVIPNVVLTQCKTRITVGQNPGKLFKFMKKHSRFLNILRRKEPTSPKHFSSNSAI